MKPISAYEFFQRHGKIKVNGTVIQFFSYEDYLDYIAE